MTQQETKDLLKFFLKVLGSALIVLVVFKLMGPLPTFRVNNKNLGPDNFFVTGEGTNYVSPDTAKVSVGINANSSTAADAKNQANKVINQVTTELKKLGVNEKDIKTTNFNIYPNYGPEPGRITGYNANATLTVTEKDLERVNKVVDTAVANGANQVMGIYFEVSDREKALDVAREEAIKNAKEKAQKLANQAGVKLGRIINVSEYSQPNYYGGFESYAKDGAGGGNAEPTQIQPGQTELKLSVTLTYETL